MMRILLWISLLGLHVQAWAQSPSSQRWVDSVYQSLSPDERIGQLFMVAAYSNKGPSHLNALYDLVSCQHIGGVIFFQGGPVRQVRITNLLQEMAKVPLLVGMDAEWGPAMRLDSVISFPYAMTAGFVPDTGLVRRYGYAIGRQCARLGVHLNFAPVVDMNTNPLNPIINARAFGEDPQRVTEWALAFHQGQREAGVLGCAKHFPGHGDTQDDSHKTLPTVNQTKARLRSTEWQPYRALAKEGIASVMVGHLNVPALDSTGTPASLSKAIIGDYLRGELGFKGLVVTDALNMKGVSRDYKIGTLEVKALQAGHDLLLFPEDVPAALDSIQSALAKGTLDSARVAAAVKAVLAAKFEAGLGRFKPIVEAGVVADLNQPTDHQVVQQVLRHSISLLTNRKRVVPLNGKAKVAVVTSGMAVPSFLETAGLYAPIQHFEAVYSGDSLVQGNDLMRQLADFDKVVLVVGRPTDKPWKKQKLSTGEIDLIQKISLQNSMVLVTLANPYVIYNQPILFQADAVLVSPESSTAAQSLAAQALFGSYRGGGELPVQLDPQLEVGHGLAVRSRGVLGMATPEEVGMNSAVLHQIDSLVAKGLRADAYPGCQVLVARKGKVVYHKAFGYQDVFKTNPVKVSDIYDLASITKIAAGVPAVMHLVEEGDLDLDARLKKKLPASAETNKAQLTMREILAHQARLQPYLPFYTQTLVNGKPDTILYRSKPDSIHTLQVAEGLYLDGRYPAVMYQAIYESALLKKKQYKYSDLGYYFVKAIAESETGKPLDELTAELLAPLEAPTLRFKPLDAFPVERIIPTEDDRYFRQQLLRGHVHDPGAAMMGGVAGHAGMFSNAFDLAKLMQMYLNKGRYNGARLFKESTIHEFIQCQYCKEDNRRGIGFDKPQLNGDGPTCGCVSMLSFGHTGFTGTMAWADPEQEIVYIFLSNRVHPTAENTQLIQMGTRTQIQEIIYQAIEQ
jgi:beta-glucosidase-like glycosyl hydrolase/CubicO group peptidase (beta-lactamase class C family)